MGILTAPPVSFELHGIPDVLFGGDALVGALVMTVNKGDNQKARKLTVMFKGEEECEWTETTQEGSGENRRTVTHHYRGRRVIFEQTVVLWQGEGGVPPGTSNFQFAFNPLPVDCPRSCEEQTGRVFYNVHVCLDVPMGRDAMHDRHIAVETRPSALLALARSLPREMSQSRSASCCCFGSGSVEGRLAFGEEAFPYIFAGAALDLRLSVNNNSSRTLSAGNVKLLKQRTFVATGKSRSDTRVVWTLPLSQLLPMDPQTSKDIVLDISQQLQGFNVFSVPGQVCRVEFSLVLSIQIAMCKTYEIRLPVIANTRPPDFEPQPQAQPQLQPQAHQVQVKRPSEYDSGDAYKSDGAYGSAPEPVKPQVQGGGVAAPAAAAGDPAFQELLSQLDGVGGDKAALARDWFASHPNATVSPDQLASAVSKEFSLKQADFVREVARVFPGLTCAHAAAVLGTMSFSGKKESLEGMAPFIVDKHNKHVILDSAGVLDRSDYERILS